MTGATACIQYHLPRLETQPGNHLLQLGCRKLIEQCEFIDIVALRRVAVESIARRTMAVLDQLSPGDVRSLLIIFFACLGGLLVMIVQNWKHR
jgi:hypothetical protein